MTEKDFDAIYGAGAMTSAMRLIDALAPVTRRDEWWATEGPYEIIAQHFAAARDAALNPSQT